VPPPTALPLKSIKVGMVNTGMSYLQQRIAQVQGYYREAGFDAELQVMQSTTLLAGLAAGEIDFADSGGSAIRAAATGLPVRLVACHGVRPLYSVALAPGVQTARDLESKGFAINSAGDDTHVIARELIRKYGGDPTTIEYVGLGTSAVRLAAVESGRVGGAILSSAETIQAREAGLAILNTADDLPLACNSGSVVTVASLAERPAGVRGLVSAVHRAVRFMHEQRAESIRILADWQQLDERQATLAFDAASVQLTFSTDRASAEQAIENALDFAKQAGHVEPGVQLRDVADLSYYP
jgi:NitT/TauT family transport system substrate-binding protein